MMVADAKDRRFILARCELSSDTGALVGYSFVDPLTGSEVDSQDSSRWMTLDVANTFAASLTQQSPSQLVVYRAAEAEGAPPPVDPYISLVDRTDAGNANLLIHLSGGNLRYVHETRQWLRWSGARWQLDEHETFVTGHALEVAKAYLQQANSMRRGTHQYNAELGTVTQNEDLHKWAAKCRSKGAIEAMITLARKVAGVPISVNDLDRDPWLLGVENGVVDLRNGELRETEAREDYVTKRCRVRYNPRARAPRWEAFIQEITGAPISPERDANGAVVAATVGRFTPRPALARYLQKALGYSITGTTREQKFFIAIGDGSNGKSVVFDCVKDILGPYGVTLPSEAFLAASRGADSERPTAIAAGLAGARFVVSSETKAGQKLDIGIIKNHTGDKEMTARRLYGNPVTFAITHKPWLSTNVRPALDHIDPAARGRLHLLPFERRWNRPGEYERDATLPDGDKTLAAQLAAEAEGILVWLVQGALMYQHEGLTPPAEVVALTRDYVQEQDTLGRWLSTLQRCSPDKGTLAAELLRQYATWCVAEGCAPDVTNSTAFGRALEGRGIEWAVVRDGTRYGLTTGGSSTSADIKAAIAATPFTLPKGVAPAPTFLPTG